MVLQLEYKRKFSDGEQDRDCVHIQNTVAVFDVKSASADAETLPVDNKSLKASRDMSAASRSSGRRGSEPGTQNRTSHISVDCRFIGIGEGFIRQMLGWAQKEVPERRPDLILPTSNWRNRAEAGLRWASISLKGVKRCSFLIPQSSSPEDRNITLLSGMRMIFFLPSSRKPFYLLAGAPCLPRIPLQLSVKWPCYMIGSSDGS